MHMVRRARANMWAAFLLHRRCRLLLRGHGARHSHRTTTAWLLAEAVAHRRRELEGRGCARRQRRGTCAPLLLVGAIPARAAALSRDSAYSSAYTHSLRHMAPAPCRAVRAPSIRAHLTLACRAMIAIHRPGRGCARVDASAARHPRTGVKH